MPRFLLKTIFFSCLFLLTGPVAGLAQIYGSGGMDDKQIEAGITLGGMNSVSDIMGNKHVYQGPFAGVTLRKTKLTAGIYGNFIVRDKWGGRLELNYGTVEAHDSLNADATAPSAIGRYERNLNFRTRIFEAAILGEAYFLNILRPNAEPGRVQPYLLGGFSVFHFNPQTLVGNEWIYTKPLRLEGQGFAEYPQRKEYSLYSWSYPIGGGLLFNLSPAFNLRLEVLKRTTFTDYLDDVHYGDWVDPSLFFNYLSPDQAILATQLYNRSLTINPPRNTRPRGHEAENDAYWSGTVKLGYKFNQSIGGFQGGRLNRRSILRSVRCFEW